MRLPERFFGQATIHPVLLEIGGAHVTAQVATVNASLVVIVANDAAFHFFGHRLAHFVAENESGLVRQAKIAAHRQHALALHFVAEHGDGREIAAQGQLVIVEQRSRRDAEILFTGFAAEAESAGGAAALVSIKTAAIGANRRAVCMGPADLPERGFRIRVDIRNTFASVSVLAGLERRKCWATGLVSVP